MSVVDRVVPERATRFVEFCGVGAVGMVVDLAITFALLATAHPLAANAAGFAVAVTHNFAGNWWLTFDKPDGDLGRQYVSYVALHLVTFGVRAVVLTGVLAATALPATVATLVGVGAAAIANYVGTERIFDGDGSLWFDVVAAANHAAHWVFHSRVRALLVRTGLYNLVFDIYAWGLAAATPGDRTTIEVGGVAADLRTVDPTETVSVLHTLENETPVLRWFIRDVQPGDRVLDVGANLGVYAALASECGGTVAAVEPHPRTAARCRANVPDATVHECALGPSVGTVGLAVARDAVGTQRPHVGGDGLTVRQLPGDRLATPDVAKVDVEGAECGVLNGLARTLAEAPPRVIYVETHGDETRCAVQKRLTAAGYDEIDALDVGADETMLRASGADDATGAEDQAVRRTTTL